MFPWGPLSMTIFGGGLLLPATPEGLEKGHWIRPTTNEEELLQTEVPNYLQGRLEEANTLTNTLIAFYSSRVSYGNILVRSTHTDVLAIFLGRVDVPAVTSLYLLIVWFQNKGSGRGPTRLIRLVWRVPPTTDGTRHYESGNAWSEDSDDI